LMSECFKQLSPNCSPDKNAHSGARCLILSTPGPPLLLAFVDFLRELAKLLGLFVACLYL
jgi:hypothetical protein